jgi:hypothetical protein
MKTGVLVRDADLEMQDVAITAATDAAVEVAGSGRVTLRANRIHDNPGAGILIRAGASPWLAHNALLRNGRGRPARAAVEIEPGARPVLLGNAFAGNAQPLSGVPAADRQAIADANVFAGPAAPVPPRQSRPR